MRISKVKLTNVHGLHREYELGLVNIICGANMVGKTAIAKAIRLHHVGYLPEPIGKLPGRIYRLAGDVDHAGVMRIDTETNTGRKSFSQWTKDEKGSVKSDGGVPADLRIPELLSEPKTFFGKTGAERMKIIFDACDLTKTGFNAQLLVSKLGTVQQSPATVCEAMLDSMTKRINNLFTAPNATVQTITDTLITELKVSAKAHKDEAAIKSGAFAGLRNQLTIRPTDLSGEIVEVENQLKQIEVGSTVEFNRRSNAAEEAGKRLVELGILTPFDETMPAWKAKMEKSLAKLQAALKAEKAKPVVDVAKLTDENNAIVDEFKKTSQKISETNATMDATQATLTTIGKLKLCAKCKKTLTGSFTEHIELLKDQQKTLALMAEQLRSESENIGKRLNDATTANNEREGNIQNIESAIEKLIESRDEVLAAAEDYQKKRASASELTRPDTTKQDALNAKLTELRGKQNAFLQYKRDVARRDQLEGELLVEQCKEAVCKDVLKIVQMEQQRVANDAFNSVLKVAREFTDGILNSPLEFKESEFGRRIVEADVENGCQAPIGSWVPWECFSGTEDLLAINGLGVALCQNAPIKLVFFDELGRIAEPLRIAVVERMVALTKGGIIDQVLMIDVTAKPYVGMKGVNVIEL